MAQPQVVEMTLEATKTFLVQNNARHVRDTPTSKVYVSESKNQTYTIFAARKGVLRVQITAGCVC